MGFISRYILPQRTDFDGALLEQAKISQSIIAKLHQACRSHDSEILQTIAKDAERAAELKTRNMAQLLQVFITPYDKESIFRMITQLDWICLSAKHFQLETEVYDIHSLGEYEAIVGTIVAMSRALEDGVSRLEKKDLHSISTHIFQIYQQYDRVVKACAHAMANLLEQDDIKRIIQHRDILLQLKEVARRIHISANTLEDMALKIL